MDSHAHEVLLAPSKSQQLADWMKARGLFRTHEVIQWGLDHYFNRALRTKGQLHHDGLIRELSKAEKGLRRCETNEGVYEWVGHGPSESPS